MAIALASKANTSGITISYPYGDIRDDDGTGNGTPVNSDVYADFHQFFARMLAKAGVTANGLRDNAYNGFQYFDALAKLINTETNVVLGEINTNNGGTPTTILTIPRSANKTVRYDIKLISRRVSGGDAVGSGNIVYNVSKMLDVSGTGSWLGTSGGVNVDSDSSGAGAPTLIITISGTNTIIAVQSASGSVYRCRVKVEINEEGSV